jgi:dienelactone hydrolase
MGVMPTRRWRRAAVLATAGIATALAAATLAGAERSAEVGAERSAEVSAECSSTVAAVATQAAAARRPEATFPAHDSLAPRPEDDADARACLDGLLWKPGGFTVRLEEARAGQGDLAVRFPSPLPGGIAENDDVSLEWYLARDADGGLLGDHVLAPACIVVHESGSGMPFGRLFARGLAARGVHACMIHLPFYGLRRPPGDRPGPEATIRAVRQAVADVRRAADAVAALPGIDADRIALEGTSLGGFVAATAGALDGRFSRVFIVLAGGDIAGVIGNGGRDARVLRERLMAAGMTEAEICETVAAVEPLRLAHRLDPGRTWLYSATHDDVVPPRHARLLAEAAGLEATHHVELHANHYTGIVYLPLVLAQIRNHMADGGAASE